MRLKQIIAKAPIFGLLACAAVIGSNSTASAHVTVKPAEVVTAGYQTFTVNVPNEKEIPTIAVKVLIPSSVTGVTPTQKQGWQITAEKEGAGEDARVTSITWSDGAISTGLRDEFTFSAKVPKEAGELQWKAYQTYSDGTVVSWDQASEGGHSHDTAGNSGPFSVTKVVDDTEADKAAQQVNQVASDARVAADRALYIGVAGVVVGLLGIFLATRKKS